MNSISQPKLTWIFVMLGLTLLLAGSVFGVDWANYFLKTSAVYPVIAKPVITVIAMILVLAIGKNRLSKRDWWLLFAAFCCMLPTDILMSVVVFSPTLSVGGLTFMIGGVLSIIAHLFLIIRLSKGINLFKPFNWKGVWLPILIYGIPAIIIVILWQDIVRVGHAAIAPAYTAFFCTTMWLAWEKPAPWLPSPPPAGSAPRSPARSTTWRWATSPKSCSDWCGCSMAPM